MEKMKELVEKLNRASAAYYNGEEIMSNYEYDALFDELVKLENETGIVLKNSPTHNVGFEAVNELEKYRHEYVALSLAKTKDIDHYCNMFKTHVLSSDQNDSRVVLMWKCDGSTIQLYYNNGKLEHAVTRGNGEIGSVIDHNVPFIKGIPMKIDFKGKLVVRGEALMTYSEFNKINSELPEEEQYKNPRNLANATITLLDPKEMRTREIQFHAFEMVDKKDSEWDKTHYDEYKIHFNNMDVDFMTRLNWLSEHGFNTVERACIHWSMLKETMEMWEKRVEHLDIPVDGLVTVMNDTEYTRDLPGTGHNPHIMKGYAFKWKDETVETTLRNIRWQATRTGILAPVAEFDPVELEGTTVTNATLHNLSFIFDKDLKIGDRVMVYKANKIIPAISENLDSGSIDETLHEADMLVERWLRHQLPTHCPVCGHETRIQKTVGNTQSYVLRCNNPNCGAKKIRSLAHFCERDCMNIIGMSETTIEKLVEIGAVTEYADFFKLADHPEIAKMEGFGDKSWKKMIESANKAGSEVTFIGFMHSLGIDNIGKGQSKLIMKYLLSEYRKSFDIYREDSDGGKDTLFYALCKLIQIKFDFTDIDGIGSVMNASLYDYFTKDKVDDVLYGKSETFIGRLLDEIAFVDEWTDEDAEETTSSIAGLTFVITGEVHSFKNRDELKAKIESLGGKTSGSVSSKTNYLINNDMESTSGKNKKAKELGVKIISEDEFLEMIK